MKKIYIQCDIKNKIKTKKKKENVILINLNSIISIILYIMIYIMIIYHDYNQKYTKFTK